MADSEDDFDSVLRSVGAAAEDGGDADEFDAVAKDVGLSAPDDEATSAPNEPTMGTGDSRLDNLLKWYSGMSEAATLNHAGEIGQVGSKIGTALADMLQPSRARDGMEPEFAGERGANADELVRRSMESGIGKAGYVAGVVAPAVASGGASAATLPARVGVGAAQGALAAGGDSGHDPLAMLTGGATGGALAGLGGALASKAEAAVPLTHATRAEQLLSTLSEAAKKGGGQMGTGAAVGALLSGSKDPVDIAKGAAMGALGGKALGAAGGALPRLAPYAGDAFRALSTAAAPVAGATAGRTSKASAQADVAYGTAPTMAWAVESVLTSGNSGLDPKDEQQLTEAVMSGDEDRMIAANFALQQRSPRYAAQLRRELESLQEE